MGKLRDQVAKALRADRYVVGDHADNMLRERGIVHWQIVDGLEAGKLLSERPWTKPNPTIEIEQLLADGTPVKCVWAYLATLDLAKLVTVHFIDR